MLNPVMTNEYSNAISFRLHHSFAYIIIITTGTTFSRSHGMMISNDEQDQ
jgi:hypothetical protein